MADLRIYVVRGSSPTSSEALNIWVSDITQTTQAAADFLRDAYVAMAPVLSDDGDWDLDPVVRVVEDISGTLQSQETATWSAPVAGTGVGSRPPDATALLVAWGTTAITGGKLIRGRTFFPYPAYSVLGEGQVSGGGITALNTAVAGALAELQSGGFGIWRRPVNGAGGAFGLITTGAGRLEYSYQGRRRN